jgi:hypothetical protein
MSHFIDVFENEIATQAGPWLVSSLLLNSDIAERDGHSWFGVSFRRKTRRSTSRMGFQFWNKEDTSPSSSTALFLIP